MGKFSSRDIVVQPDNAIPQQNPQTHVESAETDGFYVCLEH